MSLIIKGMKFPKNCMECELRFIARGLDTECIFSNDVVDDCTDRRLYRCPLVELPTPHGRLIDADSLIEYINKELKGDEYIQRMFRRIVKSRPTVIEAEVSEW
jgi:hypothetical protein